MRQDQDDDWNILGCADLAIAVAPWDALDFLGEWFPDTEVEEDIREMLETTVQVRHLPSLYGACLKRISQICEQLGLRDMAHSLFFTWQDLPLPTYPEFDWIPLPVKRGNADLRLLPVSLHPFTTPPEVVEDATNGWRDGRWNPITAQQEALLRPLLEQHNLQLWADTIVAMSQNCIRFEKGEHQPNQIGTSRLGGLPDVPEGWVWPENLEFLAQFNLEQIVPFDVNHALPSQGLLRIFAVNDTLDQCYIELDESDINQLKRAPCPSEYNVYGLEGYGDLNVYSSVAVTPCRVVSLPTSNALHENCEVKSLDDILEGIYAVNEQLIPSHTYQWNHQLLGFDNQGFFLTHTEEDQALLFMMDSSDDLGTNFNGRDLLFSMSCQDLGSRRFNKVDAGVI